MSEHDEVMPEGPWAFDEEVTAVFADMLSRSIPGYEDMRALTHRVGMWFSHPDSEMCDLGCSRGDTIASFLAADAFTFYRGIDASAPMTNFASLRFEAHSNVRIEHADFIDMDLGSHRYALITAVLAVQFTLVSDRKGLFHRLFHALEPGGGLILVEKVRGRTPWGDDLFDDLYYEHKRRNGYTDEAIVRKAAALEGVMAPVSAHLNETWLEAAGFINVECVWRHLNFAAWVGVKPE